MFGRICTFSTPPQTVHEHPSISTPTDFPKLSFARGQNVSRCWGIRHPTTGQSSSCQHSLATLHRMCVPRCLTHTESKQPTAVPQRPLHADHHNPYAQQQQQYMPSNSHLGRAQVLMVWITPTPTPVVPICMTPGTALGLQECCLCLLLKVRAAGCKVR